MALTLAGDLLTLSAMRIFEGTAMMVVTIIDIIVLL
jgi:hypothetical protein